MVYDFQWTSGEKEDAGFIQEYKVGDKFKCVQTFKLDGFVYYSKDDVVSISRIQPGVSGLGAMVRFETKSCTCNTPVYVFKKDFVPTKDSK